MLHAVKKVEYVKEYKLKLTFRNKDVKIVDLEKELWGPMFDPLKNIEYFKKVKIDDHTIVWPNEVDFCPDMLYKIGEDESKKEMDLNKNISQKKMKKLVERHREPSNPQIFKQPIIIKEKKSV